MRLAKVIVFAILLINIIAQEEKSKDIVITLSSDKNEYTLNEEIQLELKVENVTDKPVEISTITFDERSISFEIQLVLGEGKAKAFTYSIVSPDPHVASRLPLTKFTLKPKSSVNYLFKIPAIIAGKMDITCKYSGNDQLIRSNTVTIDVKPAEEQKRIACQMTLAWEKKEETIVFDLYPEYAPNNICNFVSLAKKGFFDELRVVRIIKNAWIHSGCPYDNGFGTPGFVTKSEAEAQKEFNNLIFHDLGTLSLSQSEKEGYCGSQFFICLGKLPNFDSKFTIIGKADGQKSLDIIKEIGRIETDKSTDTPKKDIVIKEIKIITK